MILSVASLAAGEVYLRGEPILLQEWPEADSKGGGGGETFIVFSALCFCFSCCLLLL